MSECADHEPGSQEFWTALVAPLCTYMADLEHKDAAMYVSVLTEQKYQIRHMRKLTMEKLRELGIAEGHCEAIIDSIQAFIAEFEARATSQLDEMTFTPATSDSYFQDLMQVSNKPPPPPSPHSISPRVASSCSTSSASHPPPPSPHSSSCSSSPRAVSNCAASSTSPLPPPRSASRSPSPLRSASSTSSDSIASSIAPISPTASSTDFTTSTSISSSSASFLACSSTITNAHPNHVVEDEKLETANVDVDEAETNEEVRSEEEQLAGDEERRRMHSYSSLSGQPETSYEDERESDRQKEESNYLHDRGSLVEPRGSCISIASSVASNQAAEEYYEDEKDDNDRDSMMLDENGNSSSSGGGTKPLLGDAKTTRRHELAMQKALKLAQFKKQKAAEHAGVKPVAGVAKAVEDEAAKARVAKQLAKAKSIGEARKQKTDGNEHKPVAPRPQGSGSIDEKTQARLSAAMEKAKLLAAKRMHGGTAELPPPPAASASPPTPPKMDPKTQARLEKEMAKAKALAAAKLAKIESEKVVDEIPPLPPPDAVLTPEQKERLEADIAKAKARAEAIHQRRMQQIADEQRKKELREKPEVIEEDPKVLEKRKQELEALKQKVAEREREKRNLRPEPPKRPPAPPLNRATSAAVHSSPPELHHAVPPRPPSKIIVSRAPQRPEDDGDRGSSEYYDNNELARRSSVERYTNSSVNGSTASSRNRSGSNSSNRDSNSNSNDLAVVRARMKRSSSVERSSSSDIVIPKSVVSRANAESEKPSSASSSEKEKLAPPSEGRMSQTEQNSVPSPRASEGSVEVGELVVDSESANGEDERGESKQVPTTPVEPEPYVAKAADSPRAPPPKPKVVAVKKPPPAPEPAARDRINSADFYLSPLEVLGAAPQCMLCDAAPAEVYCEDCKESFCNVNECNRDTHRKIAKARHYKRLYQVRKKLVSLLVNCYICGQQFSVASLAIHYDTCRVTRKLGLRELPPNLRPPINIDVPTLPIPDEATATTAEVKAFNEEHLATYRKFNMVACPGCDRRFEPDRIQKHMRGCDNLKS